MALIENLKQAQNDLSGAKTDYDKLFVLAKLLAWIANDPIITSPEVAQMLRDISIDSMRANHNKTTAVPELAPERVSQAIIELLAKLPAGYISSHELAYNPTTKTYHLVLLPTHTLLFKEASGNEAIERTSRYVAEREQTLGLPVGVIDEVGMDKERDGLPVTPASAEERARTLQMITDYLREPVLSLEAVTDGGEGEWCAETKLEQVIFWVDDIHHLVENCVHIVSREPIRRAN